MGGVAESGEVAARVHAGVQEKGMRGALRVEWVASAVEMWVRDDTLAWGFSL